jgi:methyl coenzyme M reductase subunit C
MIILLALSHVSGSCKVAINQKSRVHPITPEEIKKEIDNNLLIIQECRDYPDVVKEAILYNEYLLFKYLKLPTVHVKNDDVIEKCKRVHL